MENTPYRRRKPKPKPHPPSGMWRCSIGVSPNEKKQKLLRKWFYWQTEAEAIKGAEAKAKEWWTLQTAWDRLKSLAPLWCRDNPHWLPKVALASIGPTPQAIAEYQNRPPTSDDIAEAHTDILLADVLPLFLAWHGTENTIPSTVQSLNKNIKNALTYFAPIKVQDLTEYEIKEAKQKCIGNVADRTAKNYFSDLKQMLNWFYDSEYNDGIPTPKNWKTAFRVKVAHKEPKIPTAKQLALSSLSERERLYCLLALNTGMIPCDIAAITNGEWDRKEGYVFWWRRKEPDNRIYVRHNLWAETSALLEKFATASKESTAPILLNSVGKRLTKGAISELMTNKLPLPFMNIRKATAQRISDLLAIRGENPQTVFVTTKQFLAQKQTDVVNEYRTLGKNGFIFMNKCLAEVGEQYRKDGIL